MKDLTVLILTKNEENNIKKCITSFNCVAKRFVVVDSFSDDKTRETCLKLKEELKKQDITLDFYEHTFKTYSDQLNWGLDNTNIVTKWTMRMDADEELTKELADEIEFKLDNISDENINGIILKRRMYFMGRWIKHGGRYPEYCLRIFKTGIGKCEMRRMDEHIILSSGKITTFKNDFIDKNTKDLAWWTNKHNWYSNREVLDYQERMDSSVQTNINEYVTSKEAQKKRNLKNNKYYKFPKFFRAKLYFIYRYYIKLGFLDGKEGKIYHFLQAYWYRFLVDAKIYECEKYNKKMEEQGSLK